MTDTSAFRTFSGDDFRARRKELGLGRHEVGAAAGLTPSVVARIEQRNKYHDSEYAAMVVALGMEADNPKPEAIHLDTELPIEGSWHGITAGDPIRIVDDPKTSYEFREYVPPEGRGGEHVVVVEFEGRRVRRTRTVHPWKVLRITGIGVDQRPDAVAAREAYLRGAAEREEARKTAAELRRQQLAELDEEEVA